MTIAELQIQFDLNPDNRIDVLENTDICRWTRYGYFFIDQEDGQCYLFDKNGNLDDISKVKIIGRWMFENCKSLTNIKIPNSVKDIKYAAFKDCTSLISIKIPNSVKYIEGWAFADCASLASIEISNSVKYIGKWTFVYCKSLKEVVFKGKTIDQIKAMEYYPWGIKDESIIKCLS